MVMTGQSALRKRRVYVERVEPIAGRSETNWSWGTRGCDEILGAVIPSVKPLLNDTYRERIPVT